MEIQLDNHTMRISGLRELSAANAHSVRQLVTAALPSGLETIEWDLSATTFVDSFGLGVIASLHQTASRRSPQYPPTVRLLHPQPAVQQIFELTRMHLLFEIVLRTGADPATNVKRATTAPSL